MTTFVGPPFESERGIGALTMHGLLNEVVAHYPENEAVCFHDADETVVRWTYQELALHSRRIAKSLVALGAGKGTRVAVLMGNRPEWVAWAFGVALAGGVLVPVNTMFEPPEIEYVLGHSDAAMLVHQRRLAGHAYDEQLARIEPTLGYLNARVCLETDDYGDFLEVGTAVSDELLDRRAADISPFDDAVCVYTSGTTAKPKGVLHAHRAAAIQSWRFAQQLCLDPSVRVWSAFPFFWTAGFCMVMGGTLAAGGCLVLQELFEPGAALALLESERVTSPHAWPHQLAALETHPTWSQRDLSSLRHVQAFTCFGRHSSVKLAQEWNPRSAYGLTETFTIVSSVPSDTPADAREGHQGEILPGNSVRIVDRETGQPQPAGMPGEIRVKGPTLMKGYIKVAPEAVLDEDGYFASGDAGFVDEKSRLHWLGRTSDLIKTGGANVSPVEIENELLNFPTLKSALVLGVPDPTYGQIVVLCAVAQPGHEVDGEDIREFLRGRIASYKVPRRVLFFKEGDFVMTGNEKIQVEAARQIALDRLAREASL